MYICSWFFADIDDFSLVDGHLPGDSKKKKKKRRHRSVATLHLHRVSREEVVQISEFSRSNRCVCSDVDCCRFTLRWVAIVRNIKAVRLIALQLALIFSLAVHEWLMPDGLGSRSTNRSIVISFHWIYKLKSRYKRVQSCSHEIKHSSWLLRNSCSRCVWLRLYRYMSRLCLFAGDILKGPVWYLSKWKQKPHYEHVRARNNCELSLFNVATFRSRNSLESLPFAVKYQKSMNHLDLPFHWVL